MILSKNLPKLLILLSIISTSACTNISPSPNDVKYSNIEIKNKYPYSISLIVTGDENDLLVTFLTSNDLMLIIKNSIIKTGIFKKVIEGAQSDYTLQVDADVVALQTIPSEFKVAGGWRLIKNPTNKVILDEFITATGLATFDDEFWGTDRQRLALLRAVEKFVKQGITKLDDISSSEFKNKI